MIRPLIPLVAAALALSGSATVALARMPEAMPMAAGSVLAPMPEMRIPFRQAGPRGATKPPGAALDIRNGSTAALDAESRRLARTIRTAICSGC